MLNTVEFREVDITKSSVKEITESRVKNQGFKITQSTVIENRITV